MPYRELPKFVLCPRCGEVLDRAFDGVLVCLRCEGLWISPISVTKAFGDATWPCGKNTWWRDSLACPECASDGVATTMSSAMVDRVVIDRCRDHGLWLDRGELGRLMGTPTTDPGGNADLAALRARLEAAETDLEQLLARRDAWRAGLDLRRQSESDYRDWLEAERQRRVELERAHREEIAASERRAVQAKAQLEAEARARKARDELERANAERVRNAELARADAERQAERARNAIHIEREHALQRLGDARVQASAHVSRIEAQLVAQRESLRACEAELASARSRLRAIEDQLAALDRR